MGDNSQADNGIVISNGVVKARFDFMTAKSSNSSRTGRVFIKALFAFGTEALKAVVAVRTAEIGANAPLEAREAEVLSAKAETERLLAQARCLEASAQAHKAEAELLALRRPAKPADKVEPNGADHKERAWEKGPHQ